jgi:hypothetical protein
VAETAALLERPEVTLFEAAVLQDGFLARFDVLVKDGDHFVLKEVKSKAADSFAHAEGRLLRGAKGGILADWRPYLEDVTFQRLVLARHFPLATIQCRLVTPDKCRTTAIDGLPRWFRLRRRPGGTEVEFLGDAEALLRDALLVELDVDGEVLELSAEVEATALSLRDFVVPTTRKAPPQIGYACRSCEYRTEKEPSGFRACWGPLADAHPHMLDLRRLDLLKADGERLADVMAREGRARLLDIDESACNATSPIGRRQLIQLRHTRAGTEFIDPALREALEGWEFPLHFIDFETSALALPYHSGMRPYETVAFQWSCHTIPGLGHPPVHREWINVTDMCPNVEFARSLITAIGDRGTVLRWAQHEVTVLRKIAGTIRSRFPMEAPLAEAIDVLLASDRMVDMCRLAERHHFHPDMAGSVSLKYVLPAVWCHNPGLHGIPWFRPYLRIADGQAIDPYQTLPALEIHNSAETVREGTGAVRAYQAMLYGEEADDPAIREAWRRLLLQYCELDTMAMVIVWEHWCKQTGG